MNRYTLSNGKTKVVVMAEDQERAEAIAKMTNLFNLVTVKIEVDIKPIAAAIEELVNQIENLRQEIKP